MAEVIDKQAGLPDLIYGSEDKPPFGNALLSAVTHLLAIFVPMITPALIIGEALKLPVEVTAYLVSMTMMASGVGTYLQVNRLGPIGSGMLSIQSVNFSFVTAMVALDADMKEGGLTKDTMTSTFLGMSFVDVFLMCFSARLLSYLKEVIIPTIGGVVVVLIGLSLVHVGITDFGSGFGAKADGAFGSMENLGLASLVLLIILIFSCLKDPSLRMSGIAVGLIIGYIAALFLGKMDFSALQNLPLITLPIPFKYGFTLDWHAFIAAGATFLLNVFEAVGGLTATAMISEQPIGGEEYTKRLRDGVLADDLASMIATALGSLPLTTLVQNNGAIQMTGVALRHVDRCIAAILILLGLFSVIGRALTTILNPVLGDAIVSMFDLIAIAGVQILVSHGIRRREAVITATSVGLGLGVAFEPEIFRNLPILFQNSTSAGDIMAASLNLVLPEGKTDKVVRVEVDGLDH